MSLFISIPIRYSLVLLTSVLFVSGCSSSSDSNSDGSQSSATMNDTGGVVANTGDATVSGENDIEDGSSGGTTTGSASEDSSTTRVNFDITVPVYVSNALQVRLVWGDVDTTAVWNNDELWTASVDFPVSTTNQLVVTFNDDNGAITLGSFERSFTTGANQSQSLQIAANEFDTDRWDSDDDGVSNLSELITGSNPQGNDALEPVQANLEVLPIKTFRISWQTSPSAQFYRVLENPDGLSGFTDISGELEANTTSFDHRVVLFARVNAQYLVQSCIDQICVDSDPLMVTGTLDNAIGYFKASNTGLAENASFADKFGGAVSLSADGNTMAVGADSEGSAAVGINGDQNDDSLSIAGAVYVFVRSDGLWQQQAYLKASNTRSDGFFGGAISLSADGNTLAVGAIGDDSAATGINGDQNDVSSNFAGAVYVFVRNREQWQQQTYLKASNTAGGEPFSLGDSFGQAVSLSADGNTLAVGADNEDSAATGINGDQNDNTATNSGAVYVFVRSGGLWQQQAYVKASNTGVGDRFGYEVSLSSDGNAMAVGAPFEDSGASGINEDQNDTSAPASGAVYIFGRVDELWQQQAYVKASNSEIGDQFGDVISLSGNGSKLAVGAPFEDGAVTSEINGVETNVQVENSGAVYVFVGTGDLWQQQAYLKAANTGSGFGDLTFGEAVSLSADGNTLAIGATGDDSAATGINGNPFDSSAASSGAISVFVDSAGSWQENAYIKASNAEQGDNFGHAVSLSSDGNTLAVGARGEDSAATGINADQNDNSVFAAGAVYLY